MIFQIKLSFPAHYCEQFLKLHFLWATWGSSRISQNLRGVKNQFHCISRTHKSMTDNRRAANPAEGPKLTPSSTVWCLNSKKASRSTATSPVWCQECRSSGPTRLLNPRLHFNKIIRWFLHTLKYS